MLELVVEVDEQNQKKKMKTKTQQKKRKMEEILFRILELVQVHPKNNITKRQSHERFFPETKHCYA